MYSPRLQKKRMGGVLIFYTTLMFNCINCYKNTKKPVPMNIICSGDLYHILKAAYRLSLRYTYVGILFDFIL